MKAIQKVALLAGLAALLPTAAIAGGSSSVGTGHGGAAPPGPARRSLDVAHEDEAVLEPRQARGLFILPTRAVSPPARPRAKPGIHLLAPHSNCQASQSNPIPRITKVAAPKSTNR